MRLAGVLALGSLGTSLLAACGSSQPATSPTAATQPTSAAQPTAAAAAKPAPATGATTGAASQPAATQSGPLPVAKKGSAISILLWSHFVPAYDDWLGQFGSD